MNREQTTTNILHNLSGLTSQKNIGVALLETAWENKLPMAAWQLPGEDERHFILDTSPELRYKEPDLYSLPEGFLVHPFDDYPFPLAGNKSFLPIFLQADIHYSTSQHSLIIKQTQNHQSEKEKYYNSICERIASHPPEKINYFINPSIIAGSTPKKAFLDMVTHAVEEIGAGTFQKVVPSRVKTTDLPENFNPVESFLNLCKQYPQAFISLVSIPGLGTWLGASPEILIKSYKDAESKHRIFQTVALAGTQQIGEEYDPRNVSWRQKEIEEQAMVSRYIINCFKKIRLREFDETGPKTVKAGNLMHLKTLYTVDMDATNFPELPSIMLNLLHPTSAVCGMPKDASMAFLKNHENHRRDLFSGYLGPVNFNHRIDLFVNLRCAQLAKAEALYYAGAGITSDSDPEKEWLETEMKINTLSGMISEAKKK